MTSPSSSPQRAPQSALRVSDLPAAVRFYTERLGFALVPADGPADGPSGVAGVVGPAGVTLLLATSGADLAEWPAVAQAGPGAWIYIHRPDTAGLAAALAAQGVAGEGPVATYPGYQHLQVLDPDGYVLTFWESLPLSDDEVLEIYRTGPERLQAAVAGLDEAGLDLPRGPGKWTIRQIVHHVVDSDLSTFHVLRLALALPGRQIQADVWDPDQWVAGLDCASRPVGPALSLMTAAHGWIREVVGHLPDALDRSVSWPSGYRAEVRELMRQVGGHALHHIAQITETRRRHGR
ncbi:MAG: hypothetical protein JWN15_3042 [Firmicutes bacterium]|nr:hypothetical protein [Bacillota bacterium]